MQRRSVISALYKDIPVRSLFFCLLPWNRLDVLMSPQHGDVLPLKIVTYTTVSVSLFLLLLTFILLCLLRRLRSNLHAIHRNLVAALFFSELVFLLGINQTDNPVSPTLSSGDYNIFFQWFATLFVKWTQLYQMFYFQLIRTIVIFSYSWAVCWGGFVRFLSVLLPLGVAKVGQFNNLSITLIRQCDSLAVLPVYLFFWFPI